MTRLTPAIAKSEVGSLSGKEPIDAVTGESAGSVGQDNRIPLTLPSLSGKTLILRLDRVPHNVSQHLHADSQED